jgi:D-alanine transaminase
MKDHSERLARSLKEIGVDTFDSNWLEGIGDDLLAANGKTPPDAILYLQVTRGSDVVRSHFYPDEPIKPTVFGMLRSIGSKQPEAPAAVRTVEDRRWGRCDIKSTSLLGHVMAANDAKAKGAHEAVLVRDGMVTEGSCTNVAVVVDGQVMTHPESPRILSGISRKVVLEICAELKIPVIERSFRLDEMKRASEVFLMGTTHEVWPVMSIDGTPLPIPAEGGLTQTLRTRFSELARAGFPPV